MCGPNCGVYYPRFEEKLDELDQILYLVEREQSPNYGVRVDVIKCTLNVQKNGQSVYLNVY